MSEQQDSQKARQLERVHEDLKRSLELCHSMLDDYRSKLGSNLNDPDPANDDEPEDEEEPADEDSRIH